MPYEQIYFVYKKIIIIVSNTLKLKTILFILFALTLSFKGFAQSFEGRVVYSAAFKSKVPQVSDKQMTELMGGRQEYFIKGAEYFSTSNGTLFEWQRYVKNDDKYYMKFSNAEKAYWYDATVNKYYRVDVPFCFHFEMVARL